MICIGNLEEFNQQTPDEWKESYRSLVGCDDDCLERVRNLDKPNAALAGPIDWYSIKNVNKRSVLIATDIDDTTIASGNWAVRGAGIHLGGVDQSYPRGVNYPGIGGLQFLLSLGPDRRSGGNLVTMRRSTLPIIVTSARPSAWVTRFLFRPKFIYRHLAAMYNFESALLTRSTVIPNGQVLLETKVPLIGALRGWFARSA